ncbi:MAG: serine--tRNA ligase [Pseudomonadota bacterium]|nr:serine--tRNA ligase [Pseudomonadota bacterium]
MFDIKLIRENPLEFDAALIRRNIAPMAEELLALDERSRAVMTELQGLQEERNSASKEIGKAKANGVDAAPMIARVGEIKTRIASMEDMSRTLANDLNAKLSIIPNAPFADVPDGKDETDNVMIRTVGTPREIADPKDHVDLGENLGYMDFEAAARLSGARFSLLKGQLARLERAIGQFMLDLQTEEHGYTEISGPILVKDHALYGTGNLPKFADDLFKAGDEHWLIPTAEVTLSNLAAGRILAEEDLPIRMTALTPCFRAEAGAAGKDTRGIIRQHQFWKVEMVSITTPEQSGNEHERMVNCAEEVLKRLDIAWRTIVLCTGDMGFAARKTYDIEVWLPGQNTYREISSCSNCGDFQARRMKSRYRPTGESKGTRFVHTLNGSGLAVGRTLVAVMENCQNPDGSITIPDVLIPYMGGMTRIEKTS